MKLLAIDTSSARCSAALWLDGEVAMRAVPTARDHGRLLLPMVDELLAEAGLRVAGLDALAFGRGPGSFTGVRVACSVAQGLAFGAGLGVLPVSDLRALAAQALRSLTPAEPVVAIVACMDARMGEVYWARFAVAEGLLAAGALEYVMAPGAVPATARANTGSARGSGAVLGIGAGFTAWPQLAAQLDILPGHCLAGLEPDARDVAELAARDHAAGAPLQPPEAAQPVYLRDNVAFVKERPPL